MEEFCISGGDEGAESEEDWDSEVGDVVEESGGGGG